MAVNGAISLIAGLCFFLAARCALWAERRAPNGMLSSKNHQAFVAGSVFGLGFAAMGGVLLALAFVTAM